MPFGNSSKKPLSVVKQYVFCILEYEPASYQRGETSSQITRTKLAILSFFAIDEPSHTPGTTQPQKEGNKYTNEHDARGHERPFGLG